MGYLRLRDGAREGLRPTKRKAAKEAMTLKDKRGRDLANAHLRGREYWNSQTLFEKVSIVGGCVIGVLIVFLILRVLLTFFPL